MLPLSHQRHAEEHRAMKTIKDGDAADDAIDDSGDSEAKADGDTPLGRNFSTFGDLYITTLPSAFRKANPTIFTQANMKSHQLRDQLRTLHDLPDFQSDTQADEKIDMQYRTKRLCINLIADIIVNIGNRGAAVVLPAGYEQFGSYVLKQEDTHAQVANR